MNTWKDSSLYREKFHAINANNNQDTKAAVRKSNGIPDGNGIIAHEYGQEKFQTMVQDNSLCNRLKCCADHGRFDSTVADSESTIMRNSESSSNTNENFQQQQHQCFNKSQYNKFVRNDYNSVAKEDTDVQSPWNDSDTASSYACMTENTPDADLKPSFSSVQVSTLQSTNNTSSDLIKTHAGQLSTPMSSLSHGQNSITVCTSHLTNGDSVQSNQLPQLKRLDENVSTEGASKSSTKRLELDHSLSCTDSLSLNVGGSSSLEMMEKVAKLKDHVKGESSATDGVSLEGLEEVQSLYFEIPKDASNKGCNQATKVEATEKTRPVKDACQEDIDMGHKCICECENDECVHAVVNLVQKSSYGYDNDDEPIHMTLEEVKTSLKRLYKNEPASGTDGILKKSTPANGKVVSVAEKESCKGASRRGTFHLHLRHKKGRDNNECDHEKRVQHRKSLPSSIRQTICNLFSSKKNASTKQELARAHSKSHEELSFSDVSPNLLNTPSRSIPSLSPFTNRALPPLPSQSGMDADSGLPFETDIDLMEENDDKASGDSGPVDFTTSIRQVKDYGWYWGPISGEMAERILAGEPDGSFIVRDSSDNNYIFSLTFKLNGLVRHVRIEHDQGNFSFGTFTNFKSRTIVEFIENAVKHSRSGRYLFFLHRRPILGPMRVQLLHPVSRFKQVQSLKHICRFVILKVVRWDLICQLPLPRMLKDYLNTPQYYTEDTDFAAPEVITRVLPATTPEQHILDGELTDHDLRVPQIPMMP